MAELGLKDKLKKIFHEDTDKVHPRLHLLSAITGLIPATLGNGLRTRLMRGTGFQIGEGSVFRGAPKLNGGQGLYGHLTVGRDCYIDVDCTFDLEEHITLGDRVTIGHQVMILTSTHELGPREHRAGPITRSPVTIGDGAWLGPRCIVLPGVKIGEGAIVAPGALVNKDVAAHTRVAGTPAKQVETLTP